MIDRYTRPEMGRIWTDENRFRIWLEIELLACEAMVRLGEVPDADYQKCKKKAPEIGEVAVNRIGEIERTTRHDVIAFLTYVEEVVGPPSRWLHLGLTSSDVLDTALAVQLRDAGDLLLGDLDLLMGVLERRAKEFQHTPMIGRSHGVHAEPVTFGLVLATFYDEMRRHRVRLKGALSRVSVGKLSGAMGNFAHLSPQVEAHVCRELGLGVEAAATQVVQRDRHAELFSVIAGVGASLERLAVEVRHLARTEVREAEEPFGKGQKGSSAMPHKRNPVLSENVTGLARLLRGYAASALEDVALWHERDISHSSVERVIAPDATILLDFSLARMTGVIDGLVVHPERMMENLESSGGLAFSQRLLLALAKKGLKRQAAYEIVQAAAMRTLDEDIGFKEACLASEALMAELNQKEVERAFDLDDLLSHTDTIFKRVFGG